MKHVIPSVVLGLIVLNVSLAPAVAGEDARASARVLNDMHRVNQKDMRLGQLAQEKGSTLQIRGLGENVVRDLKKADEAVAVVARRVGTRLRRSNAASSSDIRRLQMLSGSAFDEAFVKLLIKDHQLNRRKLISAERTLVPGDIKELVRTYLPTLEKHLEWATTADPL